MEHRYGCILKEERKLQAAEMKFLRAVVEKTRRERITNTYIRGELMMETIQNQGERSREHEFGHAKKMNEPQIPKILLQMKIGGRRLMSKTHMMDRPC
jgi:hypothetical protein